MSQQGNRIVTHIVMQQLGGLGTIGTPDLPTASALLAEVPAKADKALDGLIQVVSK